MCVTTVGLTTSVRLVICRFSTRTDRARIDVAHGLHALVARPTGARLVAGGSEKWGHEWIKDVHLDPAGSESVPAAFGRGPLLLINRMRPYFFSTPQKTVTGGGGLRSVTLARTAVTLYHSPSGMWVTTCVLSTCASVAIRFFSAGSVARA